MSFMELSLAIIVGVFVLKPSDWKGIIKSFRGISKYFSKLKEEIFSYLDDKEKGCNNEQINNYLKKIISISGEYRGEYDLPSVKAYYHRLLIEQHKQDKDVS